MKNHPEGGDAQPERVQTIDIYNILYICIYHIYCVGEIAFSLPENAVSMFTCFISLFQIKAFLIKRREHLPDPLFHPFSHLAKTINVSCQHSNKIG